MLDYACQHPYIFLPIQENKDIWWEVIKSLIASIPAVLLALTLLRLDSAKRKRRSKLNAIGKFSALCGKYIVVHNEQEKAELKFQLAMVVYKDTDSSNEYKKENAYSVVMWSREQITKYKLLRLNTVTDMTIMYNKLVSFMELDKFKELHRLMDDLQNYPIRRWENEFTGLKPSEAREKELKKMEELNAELKEKKEYVLAYNKIIDYLNKEFNITKGKEFKYYMTPNNN
jgi:hypothetical protein